MSDQTLRRIEAIGGHLGNNGGASTSSSSSSSSSPSTAVPGTGKPRVDGKVVIVTGANSVMGIGRATARLFAENGARAVYICDFDDSNLAALRNEWNSLFPGVDVHAWKFDAADETKVKAVVDDAVQRYGRLDVFFANAGIVGDLAPFTDTSADDVMNMFRVNVLSVFLAAKHAAPAMMKTSPAKPKSAGSIILTSSVAGMRASAGGTPYSASKAAVSSIAQTVAYQLAYTNVRINAVCPGLIETGMTAPLFEAARKRGTETKIGQLNPLKRAGRAEEIARVALFLGSDESSYVNGQSWAVDGGLSASHPLVWGNTGRK